MSRKQKTKPELSFIIPALNEEDSIEHCISSIKASCADYEHEIIVCDNGSTDKTTDYAKALGATVLFAPGVTIAKLRNLGAKEAKGDIYIFVDADVTLDEHWGNNLATAMEKWPKNKLIITGSRCLTENGSYLNKNWFNLLQKTQTK